MKIAAAVEAYLREGSDKSVTERLNAVYSTEIENPDRFLAKSARETLRRCR